MSNTFTLDELIEFLEGQESGVRNGYKSTKEWASEFSVSILHMRYLLGEAIKKGIVERRDIAIVNIAGHHTTIMGYKFIATEREPREHGTEEAS